MKLRLAVLFLIPILAFGQTSTVTVNQITKVTQPPIGKLTFDGTSLFLTRGSGSPEGVVSGNPGCLYMDTTGSLYVKTSGTGNTGWTSPTAGIGTVTSFSAGDLSPLFTTSVANSTTTPALSFSLSNASAHTFFANNTGSSGAPSFTSFVAGTDYWDTTEFNGITIGLVPAPAGVPSCLRFLDETGTWTCASGGSSGAAPDDAHYLTSQAESSLSNEVNLGALTTGLLKGTVAGSVSTISSITDNSTNWDTAYTDRLKWDGGATGLTAATGRTSLGGTTVGQNFFTLTNPSAITFVRINADNSVDTLNASDFRTAIGAGVGGGDFSSNTSTSVDGELLLFSGTGGKTGKRATGSGVVTATSGVYGTVAAPSGTIVGTTDTQTLTNKRNTPRITTITSSATPTINTDNCDAVTITALAAAINTMTTNLSGSPNNFDKLTFRIKDDGTARAITWGASFEAKGVALPTTTVISKVLTVGFIYDSVALKWGCVASAQEQ